jgi:CRP-like cAMP-binding protein
MYLEVYVSDQSPGVQELLHLAEQVRQVPGLELAVVNLDDPQQRRAVLGKHLAPPEDRVMAVERPALAALLEKSGQEAPVPAVGGIDIFADLSEAEVRALGREMTEQVYAKGQIIFLQEEQAQELFLLKRGRVQTYRLTASGKRLELATVPAGTFFGEVPLLGGLAHHATAEVTEQAVLGVGRRPALEQMIWARPTIAVRLIHELGRRLARTAERLEAFAYQSAPARLAGELLRLQQRYPGRAFPITHQELGEITGLLRETVTKLLNELKGVGLVELRRGQIRLCDAARLAELLREAEMSQPAPLLPVSAK